MSNEKLPVETLTELEAAAELAALAGEIAAELELPPTNLSFHLKALTQAGLLTVVQEGRYQRYRANIALMVELIAYLTDECCAGHPEACLPVGAMAACTNCP